MMTTYGAATDVVRCGIFALVFARMLGTLAFALLVALQQPRAALPLRSHPASKALCLTGRRCTRPCASLGDLLCPMHAATSPPPKTQAKQRRKRRSQVGARCFALCHAQLP